MSITLDDTLTGSGNLQGSGPDTQPVPGVGGQWAAGSGGAATYDSGEGVKFNTNTEAFQTVDVGTASRNIICDCITISSGDSSKIGFVFRSDSTGANCWIVRISQAGVLELCSRTSSSTTVFATGFTTVSGVSTNTEVVLAVEDDGSRINVWAMTASDYSPPYSTAVSPLITAYSTTHASNTRIGLYHGSNADSYSSHSGKWIRITAQTDQVRQGDFPGMKAQHAWCMEETAAAARVDKVGNTSLTAGFSPSQETGITGAGTYSAGVNGSQYLTLTAGASHNPGSSSWYFHGYVRPTNFSAERPILHRSSGTDNTSAWKLRVTTGGALKFTLGSGSANAVATTTATMSATTWHRFYVFHDRDRGVMGVALDNNAAVETAWTGAFYSTPTTFYVGTDGGTGFIGRVDELVMGIGSLLSAEELADLYPASQTGEGWDWWLTQVIAETPPVASRRDKGRISLLGVGQ